MKNPEITLTPPAGATVLHAFGDEMLLLVSGEQSNGKFTQWIEAVPPGGGPPPHLHTGEDEWFHVLEGKVSFLDGRTGEWTQAGPGWSAFMPRGAPHTFKNTGDKPLRLLITTSPSGIETFFTRCAEIFAQPGPPDMQQMLQIASEHGIQFVD